MTADYGDEFTEEVSEPCADGHGVALEDFVAYMPTHAYIFKPCREFWAGSSVNSRLPRVKMLDANGKPKLDKLGKVITTSASAWLDRNAPVEQVTWCPGGRRSSQIA